MTLSDPSSLPLDQDLLRQREIAAQLNSLRAPLANVRAAAARRLGEMKAGLDELLAARYDPHEAVRMEVINALGSFAGHARLPVVVDELLAAIDDPSERVCQAAIRSLGLLHARAAQPQIEEFLEDSNQHIAGAAVLALARIGAENEREREALGKQLARFLDHPSNYVKTQTARAIGLLKYQPAGPRMLRLLQETRAARQANRPSVAGSSTASATVPPQPREDARYTLLNQLVRTIGDLRMPEALPTLVEIAQKDVGLRGLAVEAIILSGAEVDPGLLSSLLNDPSASLRRRLILLMANANYQPALALLRPLLDDDNVSTRATALQALTQMKDLASLSQIEWLAFHDSNPFVRLQAARSLANLLGQEALPHMLALSADSNYEVRSAAVDHLLAWPPSTRKTLTVLARFAGKYSDDERSPLIHNLLHQHGFDPTEQPSEPAMRYTPDLPPELQPDAPQLLHMLERWQAALGQPDAPALAMPVRRTLTALSYLIRQLTPPETNEDSSD